MICLEPTVWHLKQKALYPLPATGLSRAASILRPSTLSGIFILKCSASRAISSGRSVAIAKERKFSSDELGIALLTLILLQGIDKQPYEAQSTLFGLCV
jgi:hypothetical protein